MYHRFLFSFVILCLCVNLTKGDGPHAVQKRGIFDMAARFLKSEVCYKRIGCFSTTGVFRDIMRRPLNLLPEDPSFMNIEFGLFTRSERKKKVLYLDEEDDLASSSFNSSNEVKFIIHGYMDNGQYEWVTKMTKELLSKSDFNVIVVDWSSGAMPPYGQAVANTRVVGAMMAEFITFLGNSTGIKAEDCHIIGHSLGAHAAGYCGQRVEHIARITGLDPAYPYFSDMSLEVSLDFTDADFVDVIHTDGRSVLMTGMGMTANIGHMDFYPNGGRDQPGCTASNRIGSFFSIGVFGGMRKLFACSHVRAMDYFTESINTDCPFTGFKCANWKKFEDGQCINCGADGQKCVPLGFNAIDHKHKVQEGNSASYYLKTNEESPFCFYSYWLKINLENVSQATDITGVILLTLHGTKGDLRDKKLYDGEMRLQHTKSNRSYTLLLPSMVDLGRIRFGSIIWETEPLLPGINFLHSLIFHQNRGKLYVKSVEIYKMDSAKMDSSMEDSTYAKLCNRDSEPKGENEKIILSEDKCAEEK